MGERGPGPSTPHRLALSPRVWGLGPAGLAALVALLLVATVALAVNESRSHVREHDDRATASMAAAIAELRSLDEALRTTQPAEVHTEPGQLFDEHSLAGLVATVPNHVMFHGASFHPDASVPEASDDPPLTQAVTEAAVRRAPVGTPPRLLPDGTRVVTVAVPVSPPTGTGPQQPAGHLLIDVALDELAARIEERLPTDAALTVWDGADPIVQLGPPVRAPMEDEVEVAGRGWVVHGPEGNVSPWNASVLAIVIFGGLLAAVVGGVGANQLAQRRRLEQARARLARLQSATAELARTRSLDEVWSITVRNAASILRVPSAVAVTERHGELSVVGSTDESFAARIEGKERTEGTGLSDQILECLGTEVDHWWCLELFDLPHPVAGAVLVAARRRECLDEDRSVCATFLAVAAAAVRRATYHELERKMADSLREQLLGPRPLSTKVRADVTYRPYDTEAGIGGDWYDLVDLDDEMLLAGIGDVVGHGIAAAGASGQLRTAMRAVAPFTSPAGGLERLGGLVDRIPNAEMATALLVHLDLGSMTATYSAAGHPPPLLVRDHETAPLLGGRGLPLGLSADTPREDATVDLEQGDHLVLFTDGAVERRDRSWDEGVERLSSIILDHLDGSSRPLDETLHDRLLDGSGDDATVMILAVGRSGGAEV